MKKTYQVPEIEEMQMEITELMQESFAVISDETIDDSDKIKVREYLLDF